MEIILFWFFPRSVVNRSFASCWRGISRSSSLFKLRFDSSLTKFRERGKSQPRERSVCETIQTDAFEVRSLKIFP